MVQKSSGHSKVKVLHVGVCKWPVCAQNQQVALFFLLGPLLRSIKASILKRLLRSKNLPAKNLPKKTPKKQDCISVPGYHKYFFFCQTWFTQNSSISVITPFQKEEKQFFVEIKSYNTKSHEDTSHEYKQWAFPYIFKLFFQLFHSPKCTHYKQQKLIWSNKF